MNIFQDGPLFPILTALLCSLLYAGFFNFGYSRIVEKMYAWIQGSMVYKVQIYIFLINLPIMIMLLIGVIYNGDLLSVDISLNMDEFYIFIISGYICYLEQSRHTPIRGFVFLKDIFIILAYFSIYMALNAGAENTTIFIAMSITLYLINLIMQAYTNQLESWVLLVLGFREKNVYSASFLLTQKSQSANFLQIKDIISTHHDEINEEINDFMTVASRLKKSNEDIVILTNFAKLFIPIKTAYEIQEQIAKKKCQEQFVDSWTRLKKDLDNDVENYQEQEEDKDKSFKESASSLFLKKTITTDSIFDIEDTFEAKQNQTLIFQIIKYACYPLYLSTFITGRLRYFIDYLIFFCLAGTMFFLANSISYFSTYFSSNLNLVGLIFTALLFYPVAGYFVHISEGSNDIDFIGIFMHGVINKLFILSIALIIRGIFFSTMTLGGQTSVMISLAIRMGTYLALAIYLTWIRFAMRFNNLKVFVKILIAEEVIKLVTESVINHLL